MGDRGASDVPDDAIRIRMYRVGLGDCFLVTLPVTKNGERQRRHILIDCGAHRSGSLDNLPEVVDNIAAETRRKLAVIVATHAHEDHVAGFGRCAAQFSRFEIGEVWLGWVDDPQDERALQLHRRQIALAEELAAHLAVAGGARSSLAARAAREALANLTGNGRALQQLRSAFGCDAPVRYLAAGERLTAPADVPGLAVRVLGPPRDEAFLAKMNPPAGQRYLRARADGDGSEPQEPVRPFSQRWSVTAEQAAGMPAFDGLRLSDDLRARLTKELADPAGESLAFALDQARNNASLVLLFVFRGQLLLFAGDAQYGSWRWWLDNLDGADFLPRVGFLKVAHHGSHNASPRDAIERLTGRFAAMVSTQSVPWDTMPRGNLMERLATLTEGRVVRSDSLAVAGRPDAPRGPDLPDLPEGFSRGDFWFDYTIPL